jgi:hypothetical protein
MVTLISGAAFKLSVSTATLFNKLGSVPFTPSSFAVAEFIN